MRNSTQRFNKQTEFALTIESSSYTKGNDDAKEASWRMGSSALCISIPISEILSQIVKLMSTIQFMRSERKKATFRLDWGEGGGEEYSRLQSDLLFPRNHYSGNLYLLNAAFWGMLMEAACWGCRENFPQIFF